MTAGDHVLRFRPLRAGVRLVNPKSKTPGTLGFIGKSGDDRHWIVSCYHVLIRPPRWRGAPFAPGEAIHQPRQGEAGSIVARTVENRSDVRLDCAAALIDDGIDVTAEILGLGVPSSPKAPQRGMLVVKSGMATAVTEGVIQRVVGNSVRIKLRRGAPPNDQLTKPGDSGALWLEHGTLAPVALHRRGNSSGTEFALATPIQTVLSTLGLHCWT